MTTTTAIYMTTILMVKWYFGIAGIAYLKRLSASFPNVE